MDIQGKPMNIQGKSMGLLGLQGKPILNIIFFLNQSFYHSLFRLSFSRIYLISK